MNPWLARHLIYHPTLALRGESVKSLIREVRDFNRLKAPEIERRQWEKLHDTLNYVYDKNPYYRALFEKNDLKPSGISSPGDFRRLPCLTKQIIQTDHNNLLSRDRLRVSPRKTSGSTGLPIRFVKDRRATAYMNAVMHEAYSWHGIGIGDRQARIWGIPLDFKYRLTGNLRNLFLNRKKLVSFDISENTCRRFFHVLKKFKPKYLYGLPCGIVEFTRILQEIGLDPAAIGLEIILCTGEILTATQKAFLQKTYRCPVINEYGATECGIIAFTCREDRMHLMLSNLYIEIIDPETGLPAAPGEVGEVVLTELHSRAMPFIRYRIGDKVVAETGGCSCGLGLPVISSVEGRVGDIIITPERKKVALAVLDQALGKYVQRFKAFQRSLDRLEIMIEKYPDYHPEHIGKIETDLRRYLGNKMRLDFSLTERIPPDPSGKLRCFISDITGDREKLPE
jgi:phenylacetate-CoA ligase